MKKTATAKTAAKVEQPKTVTVEISGQLAHIIALRGEKAASWVKEALIGCIAGDLEEMGLLRGPTCNNVENFKVC